jgi:hypothetical protein
MSQDTLRMGLADLLSDEAGTLFILAAYPHPSNDCGWSSWDYDGAALNSSDGHHPWNHEFWRDQVTCEPEEVDQEWSDVELEYDNAWVLVRKEGKWSKEDLPYPCDLLRLVPGRGVCAIGDEGVLVRRDGSWVADEELEAYADVVGAGEGALAVVNHDGYGRILDGELSWKKTRLEKFDNLCATAHSSVYLAGKGLFALRDGELHEILAPSKKPGWVRVSRSPDRDGSALAVATTKAKGWVLSADGEQEESVTIPKGFHVNLSVARFQGKNYLACGQEMSRGAGGKYEMVSLPTPSVVDEQYSWSQAGYLAVRVCDETLWALGKHHIAYTRDGEHWELLDFSDAS